LYWVKEVQNYLCFLISFTKTKWLKDENVQVKERPKL